jgi:hypothetical protein
MFHRLTNWLLWGKRNFYTDATNRSYIHHSKIEMLPRYFGAYFRRLFKHATGGFWIKSGEDV